MTVDEVRILGPAGWKQTTMAEFFALPLSERIRHVLSRTVEFRSGGVVVSPNDALAELRRQKAA